MKRVWTAITRRRTGYIVLFNSVVSERRRGVRLRQAIWRLPYGLSFSDVDDAVRMRIDQPWIKVGDQICQRCDVIFTESNIFNIFSFNLIMGDARTALDKPNTAVITQTITRRFFGEEDPIGKTMDVQVVGRLNPVQITGVMADVPSKSHFTFDILLSFESLNNTMLGIGADQFSTYVLLNKGTDANPISQQIQHFLHERMGKDYVEESRLQPLEEIYFSDIYAPRRGDIKYVYVLSTLALVIILIACSNYLNLATAQSARRNKEVGIRKVLGASRENLLGQFLVEAILITLIALPVAICLLAWGLPYFNSLIQTKIGLGSFQDSMLLPFLLVLGPVVIAIVIGSYPALFLSALRPVDALMGRLKMGISSAGLRRFLVIFQFSSSIVLIICTVLVMKQLNFMRNKDLGFDPDNILLIKLVDPSLQPRAQTLKKEFLKHPSVIDATAGFCIPGLRGFSSIKFIDYPKGKNGPAVTYHMPRIDSDFLKTMQVSLIAGRNISETRPDRIPDEGLINETALKKMGYRDPKDALGKRLGNSIIVGVVPDFNFSSLRNEINPLLMHQAEPGRGYFIAVRLADQIDIKSILSDFRSLWQQFDTDLPLDVSFLSDQLNLQYESENKTARLVGSFAIIAILIACLGLFGLSTVILNQRIKEIALRKIMGASVSKILQLLLGSFISNILVAFVIAVPIAYVLMKGWLEGYSYRTDIEPETFLVSGALAVSMAIISIGIKCFKAGMTNPVESIRQE